jgi:hypothetical protein
MGVEDIGIPLIRWPGRDSAIVGRAGGGLRRSPRSPFPCRNITSRRSRCRGVLSVAENGPYGAGETSRWFRKNEASLEAADTAHDRGNEGQAAANLFHDTVDDGEPETTASADR